MTNKRKFTLTELMLLPIRCIVFLLYLLPAYMHMQYFASDSKTRRRRVDNVMLLVVLHCRFCMSISICFSLMLWDSEEACLFCGSNSRFGGVWFFEKYFRI